MPDAFEFRLSFRFLGNFKAQPFEDLADLSGAEPQDLPPGVLEIWHEISGQTFHSLARWRRLDPADRAALDLPDPPTPPALTDNPWRRDQAGKPTFDLLAALLAGPDVAFWVTRPRNLDGGAHQKAGRVFAFEGVKAVEVFDTDGRPRRFPCVTENGHPSRVQFGNQNIRSFELVLDLRLPTPLPIMQIGPDAALRLRMIHNTSSRGAPASLDSLLVPNTLLAGGSKKTLNLRMLGDFALAAKTSGGTGQKPPAYSYGGGLHGNRAELEALLGWLDFPGASTEAKRTADTNIEFAGTPNAYRIVQRHSNRQVVNPGLDLSAELGGRVASGVGNLLTEVEMSVPIGDADMLRAVYQGEPWVAVIDIRLRWTEPLIPGDGASGNLVAAGLAEALTLMVGARNGLRKTRSQPQTFAPFAPLSGIAQRAPVMVWLRGRTEAEAGATFTRWLEATTPKDMALGFTVQPHGTDAVWGWAPNPPRPLSLPARFEGFDTGDPDQPGADGTSQDFELSLVQDARALDGPGIFRAKLLVTEGVPHPVLHGRLGALEMTGNSDALFHVDDSDGKEESYLRIGRRRRDAPPKHDEPPVDVTLHLNIVLDHAAPVTSDTVHGDREVREAPLMISAGSAETRAAFVLQLTENWCDDQDHRLTARLIETSLLEQAQSVHTVIEQAPFSIFRFARKPLSASGDEANAVVAEWDSDRRAWQFKRTGDLYRFTYPPLVTTDAANKPGQLELVDAPEDHEGGPLPPGNSDGRRKYVVDTRLSPPTDVWVRPTDLNRNYALPEFNARTLFSGSGDFGPGVELAAVRGELAYPLAFSVLVPPPDSALLPPRIAEVSALAGRMVEAETDTIGENDTDTLERWGQIHRVLSDRAERLEIWSFDSRRADPFVPAEFREGVNFALRRTALIAPPVAGLPTIEDGAAPPLETSPLAPPRLSKHGLPGGVLWPFESRAWLTRLLADPVAIGGSIEGLSISPHGGSGTQTAEFLNGAVKFITETNNGILNKLRVEITGRITVFWHRAKHVVIYRRSTADSAQFAPDDGTDRTERPAMRKYEEFIEILEPVRRYPDFARQALVGAGMLREVRFNSRVIHVDSAWGGDVGERGWRVPLWNPAAARSRPQVYPFPDVAFATAGEGAGADPLCVQECLDVDNMFFWADAEATAEAATRVDTDAWPTRDGLDRSQHFSPAELAREIDGSRREVEGKAVQRRPSPPRILPGLRRFTWRLAPAATRSILNKGYGDKPIFAGVESITFMRAQESPGALKLTAPRKALLQNRTEPVGADGTIFGDYDQKPALTLSGESSGLSTWDDLAARVQALDGDDPVGAAKELKDTLDKLQPQDLLDDARDHFVDNALKDKVSKVLDEADAAFKDFAKFDAQDCTRLADSYRARIEAKRLILIRQVTQAQTTLNEVLPGDKPAGHDALVTMVVTHLAAHTDRAIKDGRKEVGKILTHVETARASVLDWRDDARGAFARARQRLDAWNARYDRDKPWSPNRLLEAEKSLKSQIDGATAESLQAIEEVRQRLAAEFDATSASLSTTVTRTLTSVLAQSDTAQEKIGGFAEIAGRVKDRIDDMAAETTALDQKVQAALGKLDGANTKKLSEKLEAAWDGINSVSGKARGYAGDYEDIVKTGVKQLKDGLVRFDADAREICEEALGEIAEAEKLAQDLTDGLGDELAAEVTALNRTLTELNRFLFGLFGGLSFARLLDRMVAETRGWLDGNLAQVDAAAQTGLTRCSLWIGRKRKLLENQADGLQGTLSDVVKNSILRPVVATALAPLRGADYQNEWSRIRPQVLALTSDMGDQILFQIANLDKKAGGLVDAAEASCNAIAKAKNDIWQAGELVEQAFLDQFGSDELTGSIEQVKALADAFDGTVEKLQKLKNAVDAMAAPLEDLVNQFGEGADHARAYVDRAMASLNEIDLGNPSSVPNAALKLYAAVTQAPEIAALKANMDKIQTAFDDAKGIIESSKAKALFDQLGDALRAIGIDLPFNELGDQFTMDDLELGSLAGADVMRWFGGINIEKLKPNFGSGRDLGKYVTLTHDFDERAVRAWVQLDVKAPIKGRRALFSLGPFTLYFRDSDLAGFVRMEASKDTDAVEATDRATIRTNIEAVVGGQVMVTLQDVTLTYTEETGLDVDFDARKIKLNPTFQFIQDTLGSIFGDGFGGITWIKNNGIPIGLEHEFAMPPISLMYGTSGIQNLAISNRFSLLAYPDFIIADRFNLSRRDQPFLFSFFIIGGTGFVQVDTEYRPMDKSLMVMVSAGAGGSASLAFAFGPVAGGVFVTLSVILSYSRRIGPGADKGDGLSVSLSLIIAGYVSLWGLATVFLGIELSITYRESGQVDGFGALSVELRISRWIKLKYSTRVTYTLRNGKSQTQTTSDLDVDGDYKKVVEKADALNKARKAL